MLSLFQIQLLTKLKFILCKFLVALYRYAAAARVLRNADVTKLSKLYSVVHGDHRRTVGNWRNILSAFSLPLNRFTLLNVGTNQRHIKNNTIFRAGKAEGKTKI